MNHPRSSASCLQRHCTGLKLSVANRRTNILVREQCSFCRARSCGGHLATSDFSSTGLRDLKGCWLSSVQMKKQDNDACSRQALVVWAPLPHPISDGRNGSRSQEEILPGMKSWKNRTNHGCLEPQTLWLGKQLQGWLFSYSIWWIILCCIVYILQTLDLTFFFICRLPTAIVYGILSPSLLISYFCLSFPPSFVLLFLLKQSLSI